MKTSKKLISKKIKSLDQNRAFHIKNELNKRKASNKSILSSLNNRLFKEAEILSQSEQNEISLLSNANLNIIKILNTCANDDILDESSNINFSSNKDDDPKDRSLESTVSKWKKRVCHYKESPIHTFKKFKRKPDSLKSNKNNFSLNSNRDISSATLFSERKIDGISSPIKSNFCFPSRVINKKEIINEDKKFYEIKKPIVRHSSALDINRLKKGNVVKKVRSPRKRSRSIIFSDSDHLNNKIRNSKAMINKNRLADNETDISDYKGFLSEIEIMKINENIHDDINFIQLKKKISRLKKTIKLNVDSQKNNKKNNNNHNNHNNHTNIKINNPNIKNEEINKINTILENNNEDTISVKEQKSMISELNKMPTKKKENVQDKFRIMVRKKEIYDSMDDEEYKEEVIDFFISPDSWYIRVFDSILLFASMFYFIFVPFFLSRNTLMFDCSSFLRSTFFIIDMIYIVDLIINFFRAYQNYEEHLIRKTRNIILHYIKTWFILDFVQAIPYFSIIKFVENNIVLHTHSNLKFKGYNLINPKLYILLLIKIIKVYKLFNDNSTIDFYSRNLSQNEILDDHGGIVITVFLTIFILNLTACLFIFLGINSYSSWIIHLNIQDESYLNIYLTSIYFIIVTITTVGYGDITGQTVPEITFQIYLLIIGTIAYSFTISYISNYIVKSNKKSMTFEKHLEILQEIKMHHPNMKSSLYNEVLRNINNEQLYEKKDKHLLFDCLPYSLKNKLIIEMYKPLLRNLVFFKNIDNSDFIVKVVTSLKPLISIKNDVVIEEGDYIKEIIFVKKGIIALNICINLDDPEYSLKKYFGRNQIGKFDESYININPRKTFDENALNKIFNKSEDSIHHFYNDDNIEDIKIIEIRKNEHFGDALMFLNERCPLVAKVRTKTAECLILRKMEAIEIYSIYPNIWKRINKKSLFNMEQIYQKIRKVVIELSNRYNININSYITIKKPRIKKICTKIKDEEENIGSIDDIKGEKEIEKKEEKERKDKKEKKEKILPNEEIIQSKEVKEYLQEQPQKIIEFKENMTNISNNINMNLTLNMFENMTFFKKNTSLKETILSIASNEMLKKNSIFKNTFFSNSNKLNITAKSRKSKSSKHSKNSKKSKKSAIIKMKKTKTFKENKKEREKELIKPYIKFKTLKVKSNPGDPDNPDNFDKRSQIYKIKSSQRNSSISPRILSNLSKMSDDINGSNSSDSYQIYKKLLTKKEKVNHNTFTNLTTTQEKSFQLNSSYDNINKISNNKYIKDINLQSKIKQVLIRECMDVKLIKKKSTFLQIPNFSNINNPSTPKNSNKKNGSISSETDLVNLSNYRPRILSNRTQISFNDNRINTSMNSKLNKGPNIEGYMTDSKRKKQIVKSSNNLYDLRKDKIKNIYESKKIKTPVLEPRRSKHKNVKGKKKPERINKQLSIISKNIENTSKNINNPGEFYMNFFNNIIAQESKSINGDENSEKVNSSKLSKAYSGTKLKETRLSKGKISMEQSLLDSFISLKENKTKDSFNKMRTRQKSGFKSQL